MNKLLIPAILAVTILVAASFAFMPVQKVTTTHLPSVGTATIADGSITTAKLANDAVTAAKLDDVTPAVTTAHIVGGAVTDAKITGPITVSKLGDTAGITDILVGSQTLTGGTIAADGVQSVPVTVTGADATNDLVWCEITADADNDAITVGRTVLGTNTVTVEVRNTTAAIITVDGTDTVTCVVFSRP